MSVYSTDEEQAEVLRRWWQENGSYLIAGVVIGLGILIGWNQWKHYQDRQGQAASNQYQQMQQAVAARDYARAADLEGQLRGEYGRTPYATLGALLLAKAQVDQGQLDAAAQTLRAAARDAATEELRELANLRLSQVLVASGQAEEALRLLDAKWPEPYLALVEETRGDALRALGRIDEARKAYDRALLASRGDAEYLRLKREDLGNGEAGKP